MSDGVLKSDPDAVWNYVVSLNENKEYVDEAAVIGLLIFVPKGLMFLRQL